jgi:hypothetical protein
MQGLACKAARGVVYLPVSLTTVAWPVGKGSHHG